MNASYLRTVPCAGCKTQTFFKKLWKKKSPCQPPSGVPGERAVGSSPPARPCDDAQSTARAKRIKPS